MESASLDRRAGEGYLEAPPEQRLPRRTVARIGVRAGALAGAAAVVSQMLVGEIAAAPTAVEEIESSTWTAITSVAALFLGPEAFHGSFALGSIIVGLIVLAIYALAAGVGGIALLVYVQGYHPGPIAAATQGMIYGLLLQIIVMNLGVNAVEEPNGVYEATPAWGWWVAHTVYGAALGLVSAELLLRAATTTRE